MQKQPDTQSSIMQINSGARIPAVRLVKGNPKSAAMMSKMVVDHRAPLKADVMQNQGSGINTTGLRSVAQEGMQNVNDNETVHQLLADTELAAQILTSVILSPKDMMGVEPGYKAELTHWNIPHEVNSALTNEVRNYFEEVYKIKPRLPTFLDQALFKRGCYPLAVLPENAIDDMIHGNGSISNESIATFMRSTGEMHALGILGPTDADVTKPAQRSYSAGIGLALEHLITHKPEKDWATGIELRYDTGDATKPQDTFKTGITVTDNLHVLKIPKLSEKLREVKTRQIITGRNTTLSTESISRRMNVDFNPPVGTHVHSGNTTSLFHQSPSAQTIVKEVKTQDKLKRRSIGMPLEIHFPSEAVIPVHVPNQPQKQIGFFVLLDPEGNPINRGQGINHYRELGNSLSKGSFASSMLQRAGASLSDNSNMFQGQNGVTMGHMYGQMLERDLKQRLKNGLVGGNVSIAGNDEIYRLMLARSLSNEQTQILYIPSEYMTYIAFDYHTNGTGKSLLDNTKIIDSMTSMLLVAQVMGELRNSVGRTHVDLELDPDTPDPWKAIETMMGEIMRVNGAGFPLGVIDPLDIKDGLIRSQFQFGFSGHPRLPNMKVDFTEKNSNYQPPDDKIMENLRKRRLMAFYLTPEQVDAAAGSDFAASVTNNSTLLSKRAMMLQAEFTPQVSAHLRKHAINSADLIDSLVRIIDGSYADIMKEFKDDDDIEMFSGEKVTKEELEKDPRTKAHFIRELIEDFIGGFSMTLPEPDTTKLANLAELYEKQSNLVEAALKDWISEDMMDESIVGEAQASHIRTGFAQLKSYMMRAWQVKNGLLPELSQLTALGEDGEVELDIPEKAAQHNESIINLMVTLFTANKKVKEKSAKAMEKAGLTEADPYASGGDDANAGGENGDGGTGGDNDGFEMPSMDLGLDGAGGGEDGAGGDAEANGEATPNADAAATDNPDAPADGAAKTDPEEKPGADGSAEDADQA